MSVPSRRPNSHHKPIPPTHFFATHSLMPRRPIMPSRPQKRPTVHCYGEAMQ